MTDVLGEDIKVLRKGFEVSRPARVAAASKAMTERGRDYPDPAVKTNVHESRPIQQAQLGKGRRARTRIKISKPRDTRNRKTILHCYYFKDACKLSNTCSIIFGQRTIEEKSYSGGTTSSSILASAISCSLPLPPAIF